MRTRILLPISLLCLVILLGCGGTSSSPDNGNGNPPATCTDQDGDGYSVEGGDCGEVDCNDSAPAVNPGIDEQFPGEEACTDQQDNDCDGTIDEDDIGCQEEVDCQADGDCDDGAYCNGVERCVSGSCQAGTPVNCNDSNTCTNDVCNENTDSCTNACNAPNNQHFCCNNAACTDAAVCQGDCVDNGDCDDGAYCNGVEQCVSSSCQAGTNINCNDGNSCTDDSCNEGIDSCSNTCNAINEEDDCCDDPVCSDSLICMGEPFPGGVYQFNISNISQNPAQPVGCLINQGMLGILVGMVGPVDIIVDLPAYTPVPFLFVLPLPFLGDFDLEGTEFGTNEVIFPPQLESLDLGPIQTIVGLPGLNCLVTGTAEGGITSLDGLTLPATIDISGLSVSEGSGDGACTILDNDPAPDCTLTFTMEGIIP